MTAVRLAVLTLRMDAVANLGLAMVLVLGARSLAETLGIAVQWPLWLMAAVLAGNGAACWKVASAPEPAGLRRLAMVDAGFAVGLLGLAALNPTDAAVAARWVIAGIADLVLLVGAVKLWCARRSVSGLVYGR